MFDECERSDVLSVVLDVKILFKKLSNAKARFECFLHIVNNKIVYFCVYLRIFSLSKRKK